MMTWNGRTQRGAFPARCLALALATAMAGACSDDPTGPGGGGEFDAAAVDANLNAMDAVFTTPAWQSFEALGLRFNLGGVTPAVAPGWEALARAEIGGAALGSDATLSAARRLAVAVSSIPVISPGARGTTFVIDPATGDYTPDPARTDAPSNGVRFILYGVNPISGEPLLEQEIGHADLVDEGDSTAGIALRLSVLSGGETYLEYSVSLESDDTSGIIDVDGYIRDAEHRLDFELDISGASGIQQTFDLGVHLEIASRGFEVDVSVSGMETEGSGSGEIRVFVRHGDESIQIDITGSDAEFSAEFRVNGALFATATGDPENREILGAGGEPLTLEEQRVLGHILEAMEDLFEFFGGLLVPAAAIILLGIVL
jgi:hypothetical protein